MFDVFSRARQAWSIRSRKFLKLFSREKQDVTPTDSETSTLAESQPKSPTQSIASKPRRHRRRRRHRLERISTILLTIFEGEETEEGGPGTDSDSSTLLESIPTSPTPSLKVIPEAELYGDPRLHNVITKYAIIAGLTLTQEIVDLLQIGEVTVEILSNLICGGRVIPWSETSQQWELPQEDHFAILHNVRVINCETDQDLEPLILMARTEHDRHGQFPRDLTIRFPPCHGGHLVIRTDRQGVLRVDVYGLRLKDTDLEDSLDTIHDRTSDPAGIPGLWRELELNFRQFIECFRLPEETIYQIKSIKVTASSSTIRWTSLDPPFPGSNVRRSIVSPIASLITELCIQPNVTAEQLEYIASLCCNLERLSCLGCPSDPDSAILDAFVVLSIVSPRLPRLKGLRWISVPSNMQRQLASAMEQSLLNAWAEDELPPMEALEGVILLHKDGLHLLSTAEGRKYFHSAAPLIPYRINVTVESGSAAEDGDGVGEDVELIDRELG